MNMPKVSEEHKERRRQQILDGARRCFARHGYEGATVARLEEESGLSRGAIFNYYASKDALFIELALEMSKRLTDVWLHEGFRAVLDAIVREDPDWLAVQLEATRRVRTDAAFRELIDRREEELKGERAERLEQVKPLVREDVPLEDAAVFLSFVANGLALRHTMGDPLPDLDVIAQLVDEGVAPR
jgi:AcrR family transcriptional regulator